MKCLVTGVAGFIGSHLSEVLIEGGHEVIGVDDLSNGNVANLDSLRNRHKFRLLVADIRNMHHVYDGGTIDWVFHLAAKADIVPSIENPRVYHEVNVDGTYQLLEWSKKYKVKRFIYSASSSCYGLPNQFPTPESAEIRPMYPYALTKWMGEQYVLHWSKVYKIPALSLRLFNVYGPRSRSSGAYGAVFGVFLAQLANGKPLTVVGDGNQVRDFTHVYDVVDAFVRAAKSNDSGYAINIGTSDSQSVNTLVDLLGPASFIHIPERPGEPRMTMADNQLARNILGWSPLIQFQNGARKMKDHMADYKDAPLWDKDSIAKATKSWFEALS